MVSSPKFIQAYVWRFFWHKYTNTFNNFGYIFRDCTYHSIQIISSSVKYQEETINSVHWITLKCNNLPLSCFGRCVPNSVVRSWFSHKTISWHQNNCIHRVERLHAQQHLRAYLLRASPSLSFNFALSDSYKREMGRSWKWILKWKFHARNYINHTLKWGYWAVALVWKCFV